jgi:hypothetical protein
MVRYKMVARDVNAIPTQYRTWIVNDVPDLTGALYTGLKSGPNSMVDISAYLITDGYVIADFDLPLPASWQSIPDTPFDFPGHKVLPEQVGDSQLVIIDGYAYMFGGKITDKIYRADLNNPADWIDTGARLPTVLYNSSLAIVNNVIYLFGGNTGDKFNLGLGAVDTIFSAPVNDPLNWTNHGNLLPIRVHSSSLGMANGSLYLFGGQEINSATDIILTASTSDPLTWSIGGHLAAPLYGSTITQLNGFWYLLGGQLIANSMINTIYRAAVSAPFSWQIDGYMPYSTSYGQFFPMGNNGYYMGHSPGDAATGFTAILQAPLNSITQWVDTKQIVPAVLSHSQSAIIYDRLWFFGGSGLSAIFACEQMLKYDYGNPTVVAYGNNTRTNFQATDNLNEPFLALGIAYWRTDYKL